MAKLHIKADDNEDASLLLEADNSDYVASLSFNNTNTRIEAQSGESMHFYSENNYVFAEGDIFLEDINSGIVMKSPDGQCWRGQVDNSGSLQFSPVDCSTITAMAPISEPLRSTIKIFPNPASNILHFHSDTSLKDIAIEIFNLKGQAILTHTWSGRETDINLGNFLSGNYVIKIFDANHKLVEQQKIIIVQR
ncbi:MAG: T9SS type A sorting domain-containing protein [Chlorobi bacterium]|nr:T9SS type A sorting domain-containing protein [Chlorobiota bacterium]